MKILRLSLFAIITLILSLTSIQPTVADERRVELKINGVVAFGDLVEPDDGALEKGVLLITHGTLAHKDMEIISALQSALKERGIASLAHSLTLGVTRREGMYDCATAHTHKHEDAVAEIGAWVNWLKANGAGPISVLGHSRGGNQVAWFAAEQDKSRINALVLLAPMTRGPSSDAAADYKKQYKVELGPLLSKASAFVAGGSGATLMALPGFIYCPNSKVSAASIVSYYGKEPRRDTPALLPKIKVRVLVIAGSADTVVPHVAERVRPLADGVKIQLKIIEDAGHLFNDFYIEDAADLVAEFLNGSG